ncbi:hypothetical protein ACFE04_007084 [Oxalis oulophora]
MAKVLLRMIFLLGWAAFFTINAHIKLKLIHSQQRVYHPLYNLEPTVETLPPLYFVSLFIDTPPVKQLLVMDTCSYFLWVYDKRCSQCVKDSGSGKIYDNTNSLTYKLLPAYNENCHHCLICTSQDLMSRCSFQLRYGLGLKVNGYVGIETLSIERRDGNLMAVPNIIFGFADEKIYSTKTLNSKIHGIFDQSEYDYNTLIIGDDVILEGMATPFESRFSHYYITLEYISVGDQRVEVDHDEFKGIEQVDHDEY